ncbi:hypothetical protein ACP4OV_022256 [Aristida adscensionis]
MKILDSPLMVEFLAFLRDKWSRQSRVSQSRRRLRQLVAMVRGVTDSVEGFPAVQDGTLTFWFCHLRTQALQGQAVLDAAAVAGSARQFLGYLRRFILCSPEVDRLAEAVEELEHLAGPGGDLHVFLKTLDLVDARATSWVAPSRMEVDDDGDPDAGNSASVAAGTALPVPGVKRKRPCGSGVDGGAAAQGQVDADERRKRRAMPWARPNSWLPSFAGLFAAPRVPPPPPPKTKPKPKHSNRARRVALAMARLRRRIGKPSLTQRFSRMSL